jgi:pimeloyl-ACP methyl ester carboxylesterase
MVRSVSIPVDGLSFEAEVAGAAEDPLVLLLHGFPQTSHTWRHQLAPLAAAGYLAVAPNQRGYSRGARPQGVESYDAGLLVADALNLAQAMGHERFHVVGHDWGGQISWLLAARHPDRVRSLTVLSRPHPAAFAAALRSDPAQAQRSKHHKAFQNPETVTLLLENGAARLRRSFEEQGVPAADIEAYLSVLADPDALESAVNWYRAAARGDSALAAADVPPVSVPTLYLWGDADATVGEAAARGTAEFVTGPYQLEVLPGVGHFVTDQAGERVTELLIDFLGQVRN